MTPWPQVNAFVVLALVVVWVIILVDIIGQPRMSTRAKWMWALLCAVIWPLMLVYWITRPVQGRFERGSNRGSPRDRLVDVVLDHEDGHVDDAQMVEILAQLHPR